MSICETLQKPSQESTRCAVTVAANKVIEMKTKPSNGHHAKAMEDLLDIVANRSGAIDELRQLQNSR